MDGSTRNRARTALLPAGEPEVRSGSATPADAYVDTGVGIPDQLERLWAPYRMTYIAESPTAGGAALPSNGGGGAPDSARGRRKDPFIEVPKLPDEEALIVARGETVYTVLNLYPYNAGHLMVVPFRKVADLEDLSLEESSELMLFAQTSIRVLKRVSHPDAVNVGLNLGRASGGSVGDHLHMHIVPRWSGDANFMTVIDGTKVLPQTLRSTRALLARAWRDLDGAPGRTEINDA